MMRLSPSVLTSQKGDTLVEVVLALAILAVTLVSAFNLSNMSFRLGVEARERTQAAHMAQDQAEKLRLYRDALQGDNTDTPATGSQASNLFADKFSVCNGSCFMQKNSPGEDGTQTNAGGSWKPVAGPMYLDGSGSQTDSAGNPVTSATAFYTLQVKGNIANNGRMDTFKITVDWTSAIAAQPNHTEITQLLADSRGSQLIDCETVGSTGNPLCQ